MPAVPNRGSGHNCIKIYNDALCKNGAAGIMLMGEYIMNDLPKAFKEDMKKLLGEEYENFIKSYENERTYGLRVNPIKCEREKFEKICEKINEYSLADLADGGKNASGLHEMIPWAAGGYYYEENLQPGKNILHEAGAYYIQEPSAMLPAALLDAKPGDIVLDLCAAPGGKTTQIAGAMDGRGVLVSNEIVKGRAGILSGNVERMGIRNCMVINENPQTLSGIFEEYFDRIMVDAPCSGEGMFRKNENAVSEWSKENVLMCAGRQREILECAAQMLKKGGTLVYSTCTFSKEENENVINFIEVLSLTLNNKKKSNIIKQYSTEKYKYTLELYLEAENFIYDLQLIKID